MSEPDGPGPDGPETEPPFDAEPLWDDDDFAYEPRFSEIEQRLSAVEAVQTRPPMVMQFTCSFCNTSEEREIPEGPTQWPQVLQGIREEIRMCALLDMPHQRQLNPPPVDIRCEQSVCAGAMHGIRILHQEKLRRSHFSVALYGWVWELALGEGATTTRKIDPEKLAMIFEQRGLGRAEHVLAELEFLISPVVFCRVDSASGVSPVKRLLFLAWQRDMMVDAFALGEVLRQDLDDQGRQPLYGAHLSADVIDERHDRFANGIMERLKVLRDKLRQGPP